MVMDHFHFREKKLNKDCYQLTKVFFKLTIVVNIKMIAKQCVLVHKLVLHVGANKHSPKETLCAGYMRFLLVKLVW